MTDDTPQRPLRPSQPAPSTEQIGGAYAPQPPTSVQPPPYVAPAPQPESPAPSNRPTMLIIGVVALVAALIIGVALVVLVRDDGSGTADPTPDPTPETVASAPVTEPEVTVAATTPAPVVSATELSRSVVQILATFPDGACTGSGTIIDASGLILTNSHVITRSEVCPWDQLLIAAVDTPDLPPQVLFSGDVVADDPTLDLAVVRVAARIDGGPVVENFPAIEIGDSASLELGDRLSILGFPGIGGETITFTEGTISGFIEQPGLGVRSWVKTDASIAGGNSGGLAADAEGRIIGVPSRAGTGDVDDITDCRLVADTNRDGTIDEADSCIPTGGFINGIRPIDAAADIIESAMAVDPAAPATTVPPATAPPTTVPPPATAPPTTVPPAPAVFASNPRFSLQTTDGLPDPEVFVVPDGSTQLCLTWQYENFAPGARFELAWTVNGQFDQASFSTGTNQGGVSGQFFGCINNNAGLAAGLYSVAWIVEDTQVFDHSIYVGDGRAPLTIGLQNNNPDPICFISWTPVGAATRGLLRNTAAIQPGERFETTLASGRYSTVVGDCAGNIIFEDPDTEFVSELTLTLPL